MNYREKYLLFDKLTTVMEQRNWEQAVVWADRLWEGWPLEKKMAQAVLAAYIDGNDAQRAAKAAEYYQEQFSPLDGVGYFYLGRVAFLNDDWQTAESHFKQALASEDLAGWYRGAVYSIYATLCRQTGRGSEAAKFYLQSVDYKDMDHGKPEEYSNYLFNLHYLDEPQEFMLAAAKEYGALFQGYSWYTHNKKRCHDKIKVGYISPDLRFHVVAFFSYAFFHDYDKNRFEVYCYTNCIEDTASQQFKAMVDGWRNIRGLTAKQAAEIIVADEIDILVDLAGHTGWNLLPVLAYKPAPVQVSGIGYFDTTGLPAVDYFLADFYTDPAEGSRRNDRFFTEKLLRLPHSHFCFMWHGNPSWPSPAPFQKNGFVTFGSFNNFSKVTDEMLKIWAEILAKVPGSRLLLKAAVFNNPYGRKLAVDRIHAAGITDGQLRLEPQEADYLPSYSKVDIALDTYPYPGGGTTCDALYMGVPVVTLVGERHNARFGYSLLMNIGVPECCAFSEGEYIAKAVELAQDEKRLVRYHQVLRRQMETSPLMQPTDYMMEVESAYERIFQQWQEKQIDFVKDFQQLAEHMEKEEWQQVKRLANRIIVAEIVPVKVWFAGAMASFKLREYERAAWWLRRALQFDVQDDAELYRLLAVVEKERGHYSAAYAAVQKALICLQQSDASVNSDFLLNLTMVGALCALESGRTKEAVALYSQGITLAEKLEDQCVAYSSWLLAFHALGITPEDYKKAHLGYNRLFANIQPCKAPEEYGHRRLRIGYLSGDFRQHVMYAFYYQLLVMHDKNEFSLYAYAMNSAHDIYTKRVRQAVDVFVDASQWEYSDIAKKIRQDEIDILVDLGGHSAGSGLPVLAWRPARVQLSGLGYINQTGLQEVDYYLTDAVVDPEDLQTSKMGYKEKPLYLPSLFCYAGQKDLPASLDAPVSRNGYITFGVFNRYLKITDEMLLCWKRIMNRVPDSRLLLKSRIYGDFAGMEEVFARLEKLGLDMDRIQFEPESSDYIQRYLDVDIALDTYPWTGGGTTCDALYMGVPVITRYSERHGTRFSLSILTAAGFKELAAEALQDYEDKAVALALDCNLLNQLHRILRQRMKKSLLMDGKRYVQELEGYYRKIVRK